MKTALLALVWPLVCAAARPEALESLADMARSAPPEFAADALIRLGSLEKLDKAWRIELLEEAFRRAAGVQQPYRVHPAVTQLHGQSGFLERAYAQQLDQLSLRTRAIDALLPLDAPRARRLFLELGVPRPARLQCKDSLVAEVDAFYATLGRVIERAFSADEVKKEEPYKLLLRFASVAAPAQVGPVAQLLAGLRLPDPQFQALVNAFAASLGEVSGDDRSFTRVRAAGAQIKQLIEALRQRNIPPAGLLENYRTYLARHLSAVRCEDSSRFEVKLVIEAMASAHTDSQAAANPGPYFNDTLRADPVPPLSVQEQTAAKQEGEAEGLKSCDSAGCRSIAARYRALLFKPENIAYSSAEKESAEWQGQLKSVLSAMESWKEDAGYSAAEHFRFKVGFYQDLLAIAPPGPNRDWVLRATHDYLRLSRLDIASPSEWFLPANVLIGRVSVDPIGLGKFGEELASSADLVISLYARLERIAPRPPDRLISLF